MSNNKQILGLLVITVCAGLCYGSPVSSEVASSSGYGYPQYLSPQEQNPLVPKETKTALQTILDDIAPRYGTYHEWVVSIASLVRDLIRQLSGFAPYIAKLATPIMKTVSLVLEKGRTYLVDYVRSLPPETAQNIQLTIIELFKKLINLNLVKALFRMVLHALL